MHSFQFSSIVFTSVAYTDDLAEVLPGISVLSFLFQALSANAGRSGCANPVPYYWEAFCSFKTGWEGTWTDYMICPPAKQSAVVEYYTSRRHVGGIADLLDFTPCDLWSLIRSTLTQLSTMYAAQHALQGQPSRSTTLPCLKACKALESALGQRSSLPSQISSTINSLPVHEVLVRAQAAMSCGLAGILRSESCGILTQWPSKAAGL